MRWIEQDPELPIQPIESLGTRIGVQPSRAVPPAGTGAGLVVIIASEVRHLVLQEIAGDRNERGGLLLGEVFATDGSRDPAHSRAVLVTSLVPAEEFSSSGVSLRMESGVWERARARLDRHGMIVGWYHSHPGLGAFFSHTDRRTQGAFFGHRYSVGWVLDPDDGTEALFVGRNSDPPGRVLYCELGGGDGVGAGAGCTEA